MARQDLRDAAGLRELARDPRERLVRRDADREREVARVAHRALDPLGDVARRSCMTRGTGEVDEEVVDRGDLDQRRELEQDARRPLAQPVRGLRVAVAEDRDRAAPGGFGQAHPRVHAEAPRLVGAGHHQVARIGWPADDDRPAAELGVERLLDRGQEGVHVEVQDAAGIRARLHGHTLTNP